MFNPNKRITARVEDDGCKIEKSIAKFPQTKRKYGDVSSLL